MARPRALKTSTPVSTKSHKRRLSNGTPMVVTPGSRSSKRVKMSAETTPKSATPKKSKYFDGPDSDEDETDDIESQGPEESGYEDEDASATELDPSESESGGGYDSEEDNKRKKRQGKPPGKTSANGVANVASKDLWREGVKTGLGPGKQVFIAKPKPKGDGGVKYVSDKIHPNTMSFLTDLKANNDREWLKMHDPDYRQSWTDWTSFVEALSEKIAEIDETVPELPPKDLVFRIYRDVRFSPDPTPYKAHFSAAWSRTGRKGPYACYYVQISPHGQSFVGGGLWMPEAAPLALMRTSIDQKPKKFRQVLMDASLRKHLLGGAPHDEKKAIRAFCSQNAENALKTKPKGYEADNPNIELLRLRNFTIGKRLSEQEVLGPKAISRIMELVKAMVPFVTYINGVVMPDEDESSSSESNEAASSSDDDQESTENT